MSPTGPAHVLIVKVKLLLRQEHTTTQYQTLLFIWVVCHNMLNVYSNVGLSYTLIFKTKSFNL